jgi:predicted ATPase
LKDSSKKLYVITGGPGVGKTTLLHELSICGFSTIPEDARRIIKEQINQNGEGLPWKNKKLYAQLMLDASVKTYEKVCNENSSDIIFFDRGIIDTLCYMNMENIPISEELDKIITEYPYAEKVFILPPWEEIYKTDTERKQTWSEAVYTFDKMKETYLKYGYEIIELPRDTIENRRKSIEVSIK